MSAIVVSFPSGSPAVGRGVPNVTRIRGPAAFQCTAAGALARCFTNAAQAPSLLRANRALIAIVSRLGNDRTGLSLVRLYGHMRFRRELEHGCLLALT